MKKLRHGYSTGTCAAAASKAALLRLLGCEDLRQVQLSLPSGQDITVPVESAELIDQEAWAAVIKDGGDDLDATHGMKIISRLNWSKTPGVSITGGEGVGRVTKPGLAVAVGEPAINPGPRRMIHDALKDLLPGDRGVEVEISAPEGERVAEKTMNARLGVIGGISILGTSGLVRPMSREAYIESLLPQIPQALALGFGTLVLTPGGMGERMAVERGVHPDAIVQTSNFIGALLDECAGHKVAELLLFGHIGKVIKVAGGIFNTHSKVADARREILAAHAALLGASPAIIQDIMELNTIEASIALIKEKGLEKVYQNIAAAASQRCQSRLGGGARVGTAVYSLDGSILGCDESAIEMGKRMGWNLS